MSDCKFRLQRGDVFYYVDNLDYRKIQKIATFDRYDRDYPGIGYINNITSAYLFMSDLTVSRIVKKKNAPLL